MAETVHATNGATLWMGPASDTFTLSAAQAVTNWTKVKKTETFGDFGDAAQPITFNATDEERVEKVTGPLDAGDWTVTVGRLNNDAGQAAVQAAVGDDTNYIFKLVMDDEPINGTTATTFYLWGKVMGFRNQPGGSTSIFRKQITIGLNTRPLEVPAA
jgi:hypothetical protein